MVTVAISGLWDYPPLFNFYIRQVKDALPCTNGRVPTEGRALWGPSPLRLAGAGHSPQGPLLTPPPEKGHPPAYPLTFMRLGDTGPPLLWDRGTARFRVSLHRKGIPWASGRDGI